jgi:hypothetical protein
MYSVFVANQNAHALSRQCAHACSSANYCCLVIPFPHPLRLPHTPNHIGGGRAGGAYALCTLNAIVYVYEDFPPGKQTITTEQASATATASPYACHPQHPFALTVSNTSSQARATQTTNGRVPQRNKRASNLLPAMTTSPAHPSTSR